MSLSRISLNILRAFDAAARHLSFTNAAKELFVTQAAVAHQVKSLEDFLQKQLFHRVSRGLIFTDEGAMLAPIVAKSFQEISVALESLKSEIPKTVLHIGVVGTFAIGFLLERLPDFHSKHPNILVKLQVNNNVPDILNEHLDFAIRFGDGAWLAVKSEFLMEAPLSPLCDKETNEALKKPSDLVNYSLLRSHRKSEWTIWLDKNKVSEIIAEGTIFDNSRAIADAIKMGLGVGILPYNMFKREIENGQLYKPFRQNIDAGAYYLTYLIRKPLTEQMQDFRKWLISLCN